MYIQHTQMEKVLRFLYLRKVYLWPRYHVAVKDYLARHEPEVSKGAGWFLFETDGGDSIGMTDDDDDDSCDSMYLRRTGFAHDGRWRLD